MGKSVFFAVCAIPLFFVSCASTGLKQTASGSIGNWRALASQGDFYESGPNVSWFRCDDIVSGAGQKLGTIEIAIDSVDPLANFQTIFTPIDQSTSHLTYLHRDSDGVVRMGPNTFFPKQKDSCKFENISHGSINGIKVSCSHFQQNDLAVAERVFDVNSLQGYVSYFDETVVENQKELLANCKAIRRP